MATQDAHDPPFDFNEHALTMEPSCSVDKLSVYMESCDPFPGSTPEPCNNLDEPSTFSRPEVLVDPFNSVVLTESSHPKDSSKVDEIKRSSTRRSTRKIPSNKKTNTTSGARKSKRTSGKKLVLDSLLADVERRQRSDLVRPPRPSAWGLGGKIDEIFELTVESRKDTENVNQSVHSQGEFERINKGGLLLKLKLGKKTVPNCQINMIPDIDKDLESYRGVNIETCVDIKENFEKEISRASNENLVSLKSCVIDDLLVTEKESSEELVGISESVENRCLDPGTSPDSEVINAILDTQISVSDQLGEEGGVGSKILSPDIIDDVLSREKQKEGSSNTSFSEGCITEPLQETEVLVTMDTLTVDSILKSDHDFQISSRSKSSVNKRSTNGKLKEISGKDQADCDTEIHSVTDATGNLEVNDIRGLEKGFGSIVEPLCNSSTVANDGESRQDSPQKAWVCCDDCHKWRRISAILANSIDLTGSRWICKDNMDKTYADCSIPQEKSNADINEELELSEASCDEDTGNNRLTSSQLRQKQPIDPPQSSWKHIKTNMFLHRNRKTQPIDEVMVCHCKPPLDGRMGCRDGCLNRMLNIECVKGTCPCGESCSNQQFQKRKYSKLKRVPFGKKGFGLQLLEDIPKGRFLIEYVGEVLDIRAYEARQKEYASKGHKHFYFMTLNGSEVIDACAKGNLGRFINHSCEPNCCTEKWIVNGEVCIGLFAVSDIKKGEELTFDYNYVRVIGAAAKKCVCGSSRCRGVIGGDPLDDETVVLGDSDDEYPEPVTFFEKTTNKLDPIISGTQTAEKTSVSDLPDVEKGLCPDALLVVDEKNEDLTITTDSIEMDVSTDRSSSESKIEHREEILPHDISFEVDNIKTELTLRDALNDRVVEEDSKQSIKKPKSNTNSNKCTVLKPKSRSKLPSLSSAVKKGKLKSTQPEIDRKPLVEPQKPKRLVVDNLTGRFGAVEEALNTLLNKEKGISKRRDASKGYLTLLCQTAYGGNGKGIQSNRDLSMILGALLLTKSRTVLVDIINKNGLQMLHILLKRYRKHFDKTPILRMLLKVFEYLAETKILTLETILEPSPHGGESLKESILSFTEHENKQVHLVSRNFRDRFIPRYARRVNWAAERDTERDTERIEYPPTNSNLKTFHSKQSHDVNTCLLDTRAVEGSSASFVGSYTDQTRTRKRKSRWDEPADDSESLPNKEFRLKTDNICHTIHQEPENKVEDDAPPGFSSLPPTTTITTTTTTSSSSSSNKATVMGQPQERYNSRLPTSFGIPSSVLKKTGISKLEVSKSWIVAPAMTFHPFPPLPVYPRAKEHLPGPFNQVEFQRFRNPNTVDRRYLRQQKWNHHPRSGHPWHPNKYGPAGFNGPNHPNTGGRYGGNEANGPHNSENYDNWFYQQ